MEQMASYNAEVNVNKQILSSETKIFKTESFFYQTKKMAGIDKFVLKISESMLSMVDQLRDKFKGNPEVTAFKIDNYDKSFSFIAKLGYQIENAELADTDIVFFKDNNNFQDLKNNDQRVVNYLKGHKIFTVIVRPILLQADESEFKKLYLIQNSEYINFPLLSEKQKNLVSIENENLLVQGVAGSGKTNVCLSKIVWVACRNYTGKILYTTFSRGLLVDTKSKLEFFKNDIKALIEDYKNNRIVFLDKNHKKAIENRLGIYLIADSELNIIKKLEQIVSFLENNVEYKLLSDLYYDYISQEFEMSDETVFSEVFLKKMSNHQLKNKLEKIKSISTAVIYKEIYGMIFGLFNDGKMLTCSEYVERRQNSFSRAECEIIYSIAKEYQEFQKTQNFVDNNKISQKLLENKEKIKKYSLSIIDEVQDFTEINLKLLCDISIKIFAVGDALQMINPSYFSFAKLKQMMYREDVTNVAELTSNYRNNKKIVELLEALSAINIELFGTHSFVLGNESIDENATTNAVYTSDKEFFDDLKNQKFENFTLLVTDQRKKDELRKIFKKQEILTISEIKGLERETVLLYNILSDNEDKWKRLENSIINHKNADENSVYRYYFNLFYVGMSRAKHNIFVYENCKLQTFKEFFKCNFDSLSGKDAYEKFASIIGKIEIDEDEIFERIEEFIKLGQFDNARFYANKFDDDRKNKQNLAKIDIYENYIFKGKNREAGIRLWKVGLTQEAKKQFELSGDNKLIEFIEKLDGKTDGNLDASIVKFYVDFDENDDAQQLILEVIRQDLESVRSMHKETKQQLKSFKEKYLNGK